MFYDHVVYKKIKNFVHHLEVLVVKCFILRASVCLLENRKGERFNKNDLFFKTQRKIKDFFYHADDQFLINNLCVLKQTIGLITFCLAKTNLKFILTNFQTGSTY